MDYFLTRLARLLKTLKGTSIKFLILNIFPDSSIWRASANIPKSAFWSSILKVMPLLKSHAFIQISQGNSSIWSTPWCAAWEGIYDHLIIQHSNYIYPAKISDIWLPGQKTWNVRLINDLFEQPTASTILATHIVYDDCRDSLCWDLTPSGKCSSKSTYKQCLQ